MYSPSKKSVSIDVGANTTHKYNSDAPPSKKMVTFGDVNTTRTFARNSAPSEYRGGAKKVVHKTAAKKTISVRKPDAKKTTAARKPTVKKTTVVRKPVAKKTAVVRKPATKKTAVKKTVATKKTAVKKPVAKKPATKKATAKK